MEALRRSKIAGKETAVIQDHSLQHYARIDHPDIQRVITGCSDHERNGDFFHTVADRLGPIALRVMFECIDDGARPVVYRYRKAQPAARNKIQGGSKDGFKREAA